MKLDVSEDGESSISGSNHDDSPWGISYVAIIKKKDEGKEKWKVSQTEVESANKRSNKHNDHHLRDVFIAIMFCCNLTLSLGGEGEEPLFCLIVNFHPSVSLVGSPTRSYFPTDFLSSPSNVNREHS